MIENQPTDNKPKELYPLNRHYYPIRIKIFIGIIFFIFLYEFPKFLYYELPIYKNLNTDVKSANIYFDNNEYDKALIEYVKILEKQPKFKKVKIAAAKSAFILIHKNKDFYAVGLNLLADEIYKDSELKEIQKLLPPQYVENFKSCFTLTLRQG